MKLHIGCEKKYLDGYKHLDVINFDHVGYNEVVDVLREWSRVLKVGGVVRIAVPNFEAVVAEYIENKDLQRFQRLLSGWL